MRTLWCLLFFMGINLIGGGLPGSPQTARAQTAPIPIDLQAYASGFNGPVDIVHAGDERLFIVERAGFIRVLDAEGQRLGTAFLDIGNRVLSTGGEQGLLGLAFHPDYEQNGYFYLYYTMLNGDSRVARFERDPEDPNRALPGSEQALLEIAQPFANHNGGDLEFGPDGYLYISSGDGGSAGDPVEAGQDPLTLLGKMLRIDVDGSPPYAIPDDNPFAGTDFELDEIWALGLRNPWRFSFDRATGDLWIGDVGQDAFEEINRQAAESPGGENYGWDCLEGFAFFEPEGCPPFSELVEPVFAYAHQNGACSVTGGRVYRGDNIPELQGVYLYADFCDAELRGLAPAGEGAYQAVELQVTGRAPSPAAFGEDLDGELYIASLGGTIYRVEGTGAVSTEAIDLGIAELQLRPNPFRDRLTLDITWERPQPLRIQILDATGRPVRQRDLPAQPATEMAFDLSDLPAGPYFLRLESGQRQLTRQLLKQ